MLDMHWMMCYYRRVNGEQRCEERVLNQVEDARGLGGKVSKMYQVKSLKNTTRYSIGGLLNDASMNQLIIEGWKVNITK